jgi:glutamine amidotransferase
VGFAATVTSSKEDMLKADAVILPGVGAFGDAMEALKRLDLVAPLKDLAGTDTLLMGVCLGMQLLMTESFEFGRHSGLGLIDGPVVRFENPVGPDGRKKVPQVGWNRIFRVPDSFHTDAEVSHDRDPWSATPLQGLRDGEFMYFVHSFYAQPEDPDAVLSTTTYGHITFCSSVKCGNLFATQFHPERSGPSGLRIYAQLYSELVSKKSLRGNEDA